MNLAILLLAAVAVSNTTERVDQPARITSDSTYYDRKEGIAVFKGHVHVDDAEYQMHADRAFVYLSNTNSLSRIAAIGSVAITNELKRAYGAKVTYHREKGLVVLSGDDKTIAEVIEQTEEGDRVVRGKKIRFWVNQEQVEVLEADISAPATGGIKEIPGLSK